MTTRTTTSTTSTTSTTPVTTNTTNNNKNNNDDNNDNNKDNNNNKHDELTFFIICGGPLGILFLDLLPPMLHVVEDCLRLSAKVKNLQESEHHITWAWIKVQYMS